LRVPRDVAGLEVRRILYDRRAPAEDSPLAAVLRIEMVADRAGSVRLIVLCNRDDGPVRHTVRVPVEEGWEELPGDIRREFLRGQAGQELVRLLYTV
jgi:hypothetical protein